MTRIAKIERKIEYFPIIGGEVKATNDAQGIIEGYLNYIGNIDFGDDRTRSGAFKRTINDSFSRKTTQGLDYLWPYLWNHDYNLIPPGGIFDADENKNGLYIKTQFNMDMQMGRELYSSFKMGTMKKQSMGYKAIRYDYVKEGGKTIRDLIEVAVMEGSAVVFPMNDLAAVDTVKNTSGKRTFVMGGQAKPQASKDFNDAYRPREISDWYGKLYSLTYALREAIDDAFESGDTVIDDINAALNGNDASQGFISQLLAWAQEGITLDYSNYLEMQDNDSDNACYGYMSNPDSPEAKAGRTISAANHALMTKACKGIEGHVSDIKSMLTTAAQQGLPDKGAETPLARKEDSEVDAVSTQLNSMLASINIANLTRNLKKQ